jgi:formylglycine-generating enzyme required for sulfatase activity
MSKHLPVVILLIFTLASLLPLSSLLAQGEGPDRQAAIELAEAGVESNADWTPYSEPDSQGVNMVLVPAGSFMMGSTQAQIEFALELCQTAAKDGAACQKAWFEDEGPAHEQTVAAFWIDQTEVSRAMYAECVAAGACRETPDNDFSTDPEQPINRISWFEARGYCEWRGGRLPTDAEWEYAARGPDGLVFPWGDEFIGEAANHCDGNCGAAEWARPIQYVSQSNDDGHAVTAPVGEYAEFASWVGTLNQGGNVWEWTNSLYAAYPYDPEQEATNADDTSKTRSLRGGSFNFAAVDSRASIRARFGPGREDYMIGLRCARDYE